MKRLQVDENAMSVGESDERSGGSQRLARTAGDRRLKEVPTTLPDPQTKLIDLRSIPLLVNANEKLRGTFGLRAVGCSDHPRGRSVGHSRVSTWRGTQCARPSTMSASETTRLC